VVHDRTTKGDWTRIGTACNVHALLARVRDLAPGKAILIKATVYDVAFTALREAHLPVIDERIPFPGSGQQLRFAAAFERALNSSPASH
jgi:hypothetical protein